MMRPTFFRKLVLPVVLERSAVVYHSRAVGPSDDLADPKINGDPAQAVEIRANVLCKLEQALRCVVVKLRRVAHLFGDVFMLGCDVLLIIILIIIKSAV